MISKFQSGVIACGINGTPASIKEGSNQSLRLFKIENATIVFKESRRIIQGTSADDYQVAMALMFTHGVEGH